MAERVALWGRDIDESPAVVDDGHVGSSQHDPITAPIPVVDDDSADYDVQDAPDDEPSGHVDDRSDHLDDESGDPEESNRAFSYAKPFIDRRPSAGSTLTFKAAVAPWYRTRRGLVVLIAVVAVVVVLSIVPMLLRSPAPGSEEPTNVPPTTAGPAPTSAQPTSNSVAPTLTSQPVSPPPSPPPPPPPAQDAPAYVPQYQAPRGGSSEPAKPDINVTRAPISVSPKPVTPPDSPRTGGGGNDYNTGWGW